MPLVEGGGFEPKIIVVVVESDRCSLSFISWLSEVEVYRFDANVTV